VKHIALFLLTNTIAVSQTVTMALNSVSAAPGNIREGDLRLYLDKEGHVTYTFRSNDLDSNVPADPAAEAFVQAARADRDRLR